MVGLKINNLRRGFVKYKTFRGPIIIWDFQNIQKIKLRPSADFLNENRRNVIGTLSIEGF